MTTTSMLAKSRCHGRAVDLSGRPPAGTRPWDWYWSEWAQDIFIVLADLRGEYAVTKWLPDGRVHLLFHYKLTTEQKAEAIAHELHHITIGGVCAIRCPKNEAIVLRETAMWLLPDVEPVAVLLADNTLGRTAQKLGVPRGVIERRLLLMTSAEDELVRSIIGDGSRIRGRETGCRGSR